MQDRAEYAGYAEYGEFAEQLTADGAYHCPVGSIWLFFFSKRSFCQPDDSSVVSQEDWRWLKRELEPITNHRENYSSSDIIQLLWLAATEGDSGEPLLASQVRL